MKGTKIKDKLNYDLFRGFQTQRIKKINDFYIEVQLTIDALISLQSELSSSEHKRSYLVPGIKGGQKSVLRRTTDILNYIDRRVSYSEYAQSIVFIVAIMEDYISDVLLSILMAYPRKILVSAKGNQSEYSVNLRDVIDSKGIEDILFNRAQSRINEAMYASPKQYAAYFEKVTGFDLGPNLDTYIELKATRDLLVHNEGIINQIYLGKAGALARGEKGTSIVVDAIYFEKSVRALKNISSSIYRGLLEKYGDSREIAQAVKLYL